MKKINYLTLSLLFIAGSAFSVGATGGSPGQRETDFSVGATGGSPGQRETECVKDGVKYGVTKGSFRSEWWNYLERGTSYLEGGCYEAALSDFNRAIELRKKQVKNERDKRRARTYGLHFVDYFAHREKGIALYHLGRYEEAQAELEQSRQWVESERARQYLETVEGEDSK